MIYYTHGESSNSQQALVRLLLVRLVRHVR